MLTSRFEDRIDKTGSCWLWTLAKNTGGYGVWTVDRRQFLVHRLAYELWVGEIPPGLTVDHLCRVRSCCNPAHLEIVTRGENSLRGDGPAAVNARKTHCPKGHPYDETNTCLSGGRRYCLACNRDRYAAGISGRRRR